MLTKKPLLTISLFYPIWQLQSRLKCLHFNSGSIFQKLFGLTKVIIIRKFARLLL